MHICTVAPSYLPHFGGAEVGLHMMLSYLAQHSSHRYTVITSTTDKQMPKYEVIDGVEVFRYYRPKLWVKWYAPTFYAILNVPKLVKQLQPDLINMTYVLPSGLAGWWASKHQTIPNMMMIGGIDIYDPFNMPDRVLQSIAAYCIRHTDVLLAWSNWSANQLVTHFGVSQDDVDVISWGIDDKRFNNDVDGITIRHRHHISDDTVLLFALQRLELRKGIDILIQAIRHVLDHVQNVPFKLIIGGKGRDKAKLETLISELGLANYVILAGFISEEEKAQYYAAADIFAFHTYHEGLGIVIIEASACGLPIITTRAGGTLDVVKDGETGHLCEAGDAVALGDSIITLLKDTDKRKIMGHASAEFALSHFAIDIVSKQLLTVIETFQ